MISSSTLSTPLVSQSNPAHITKIEIKTEDDQFISENDQEILVGIGDPIIIYIEFNKEVFAEKNGEPYYSSEESPASYIEIKLNSKQVKAVHTSGGGDQWYFEYLVEEGDTVERVTLDKDAYKLSTGINLVTVDDAPVNLTLPDPETVHGLPVRVDGVRPEILYIDSDNQTGTYQTGDIIYLYAKFNEPVDVDPNGHMDIMKTEDGDITWATSSSKHPEYDTDTVYFMVHVGEDYQTEQLTLAEQGIFGLYQDLSGNKIPRNDDGYILVPEPGTPDSLSGRTQLALNTETVTSEETTSGSEETSTDSTEQETSSSLDTYQEETTTSLSKYIVPGVAAIGITGIAAYMLNKRGTGSEPDISKKPVTPQPSYHERDMTQEERTGIHEPKPDRKQFDSGTIETVESV
ncbi:hypothetical protein GF326_07865, partial [Candidatus Bathyarchaeota archaeon]|nr:hypothetical protein [Candidatus Bathyarchaeota archaeon]